MRDRNWRRVQRALAIDRARGRARHIGISPENMEHWARTSATAPQPCSGHCCGNPRAYGQGGRVGEAWPRVDEEW